MRWCLSRLISSAISFLDFSFSILFKNMAFLDHPELPLYSFLFTLSGLFYFDDSFIRSYIMLLLS